MLVDLTENERNILNTALMHMCYRGGYLPTDMKRILEKLFPNPPIDALAPNLNALLRGSDIGDHLGKAVSA